MTRLYLNKLGRPKLQALCQTAMCHERFFNCGEKHVIWYIFHHKETRTLEKNETDIPHCGRTVML